MSMGSVMLEYDCGIINQGLREDPLPGKTSIFLGEQGVTKKHALTTSILLDYPPRVKTNGDSGGENTGGAEAKRGYADGASPL